MPSYPKYEGSQQRLVIAMDLGTTYSGASFALLDPGRVPKIQQVSSYPEQTINDSKVPTVVYYNQRGTVLGAGAQVPPPGEGVFEVAWFKLLLRPDSELSTSSVPVPTCRLPNAKMTIVDVCADFYRYLFGCVRQFIEERVLAIGKKGFATLLKNGIAFVLTHPNGWGGAEQDALRRAAVQGGLVPDLVAGHERITFLTEGEASLHYCLDQGSSAEVKVGSSVMIIDAGGGTVDISTYTFTSTSPVQAGEISTPTCIYEGSVAIRGRAEAHIRDKLNSSSTYNSDGYVQAIVRKFDAEEKKRFDGSRDLHVAFSPIANLKDDPGVGVRAGTFLITKDVACGFFDPSIDAILVAVRTASPPGGVTTYCLVGGLAGSAYLYKELAKKLETDGRQLFRPQLTTKSAADGAVSFFIDKKVNAREARLTYGVLVGTDYNPEDKVHRALKDKLGYTDVDGCFRLRDFFYQVLKKRTIVQEDREFRKTVMQRSLKRETMTSSETTIYCHLSGKSTPAFYDESDRLFHEVCTITGSLADIPIATSQSEDGTIHYRRQYDVVMSFGMTELKAVLAWKDKAGNEHRGAAEVIYDSVSAHYRFQPIQASVLLKLEGRSSRRS